MAIPNWLQQNENYAPAPGRDRFIDKSIQGLLRVLRRCYAVDGAVRNGWGHPLLKLVDALLVCFVVITATIPQFLYVPLAWLCVRLALLSGRQSYLILKVAFTAAIINLIVLLPAYFWMGQTRAPLIAIKIFMTVTAMQLFSLTTDWNGVLRAFKWLRVPAGLVFILHITLKYIFVLGRVALSMMYALRLRSVGRGRNNGHSLGGVMGMLFLRSREQAQALYWGMVCRGFDGTYRAVKAGKTKWSLWDGLIVVVDVFILYAFIVGGR